MQDFWVTITITGSKRVEAENEDEAYDIVDAMSDDELKEICNDIEIEVEV